MKKLICALIILSSLTFLSCEKCVTCTTTTTKSDFFGFVTETTEDEYEFCGTGSEIRDQEGAMTSSNVIIVTSCD